MFLSPVLSMIFSGSPPFRGGTFSLRIDEAEREFVIHDLFSKEKEEFLQVHLSMSEGMRVRLDRNDLSVDPSDKKSYFPYGC